MTVPDNGESNRWEAYHGNLNKLTEFERVQYFHRDTYIKGTEERSNSVDSAWYLRLMIIFINDRNFYLAPIAKRLRIFSVCHRSI